MSRRYWRIVFTVVGLLALGGLAGITGQLYNASHQQYSDYNYQPASHPRFIQIVPGKTKPQGYQPHCQNPQTKEDADLCAQWASIEQASEANRMGSLNLRFAIASLWATAIATIALVWTLIETRDTARRQLRAYITLESLGLYDFDGDKPNIKITFKNSGQTPAKRLRSAIVVLVRPRNDVPVFPTKFPEKTGGHLVGPSGSHVFKNTFRKGGFSKREISGLKSGRLAVFVSAMVDYYDIFDRRHYLIIIERSIIPIEIGMFQSAFPTAIDQTS